MSDPYRVGLVAWFATLTAVNVAGFIVLRWPIMLIAAAVGVFATLFWAFCEVP